MGKNGVKIAVAIICLIGAGLIAAYQFGVFGSSSPTPPSGTQNNDGQGTGEPGEGITLDQSDGFIPPSPR